MIPYPKKRQHWTLSLLRISLNEQKNCLKMEKLLRDLKITQIVVGGPILRLTELSRYYFGTETI